MGALVIKAMSSCLVRAGLDFSMWYHPPSIRKNTIWLLDWQVFSTHFLGIAKDIVLRGTKKYYPKQVFHVEHKK